MTRSDVAIVIPCYNEERRLKADAFIDGLLKDNNLTFLFVDDGSTDNTLEIIQRIYNFSKDKALHLVLNKNYGKGEAVRRGMQYLLERNRYDIIGFWDADLAVPLSEIRDFLDVFRQNPGVLGVIGSRVRLAGRAIEHVSLRHYLARFFATIMCLTFGFEIYDTQCGAKFFASEILEPVIQEPFCSRWIFDVELIIRISRLPSLQNRKCSLRKDSWLYEIPVKEWINVSESKRGISAYTTVIRDYLRMVRKYGQ